MSWISHTLDVRHSHHLYRGTLFAGSQLVPQHVVQLLQGVLQGKPSKQSARELRLTEKTVTPQQHRLQARAEALQPPSALPDGTAESDELLQNARKKGIERFDPSDPPRRRANKRRGRGTFANDRPPVLGTIGRERKQVRQAARIGGGLMSKYLFCPGCSLQRNTRAYQDSLMAIREMIGIETEEIRDWNCCGATEYISVHHEAAYALVARGVPGPCWPLKSLGSQ